uniref:Uncharacterized protein n=1 Tax=Cucumis melo TaxID=3656 RepID=A0A9I9E4S6_CUCME
MQFFNSSKIFVIHEGCLKQDDIAECGYYVMRFMHDVIFSSNMTILEVMEGSTSTYSQDDLDVVFCLLCFRFNYVYVFVDLGGGRGFMMSNNDFGKGRGNEDWGGGRSAKFMFKFNNDFRRGGEIVRSLCLILTLEGGSEAKKKFWIEEKVQNYKSILGLFRISASEDADNMTYEAFGVPLMEFKRDMERFELLQPSQ